MGGLETVTACHESSAFSGYQAVGHEGHFLPQYICSLVPCVKKGKVIPIIGLCGLEGG